MTRSVLAAFIVVLVAACGSAPPTPTPVAQLPVQPISPTLQALFADYWQESLALHPLQATFVGDRRYNDQLPNLFSAEYRQAEHTFNVKWLARIRAVDISTLNSEDQLSVEIFRRNLDRELEGERFPDYLLPINQFNNIANTMVQLGSGAGEQPFKTVQDYENWLKRASRVPVLFNQAVANMREGVVKGVVQPTVLIKKAVAQLNAITVDAPEQSLFWKPIDAFPEDFSEADKRRLTGRYYRVIGEQLLPAYVQLRDYLRDEYLPKTRDSVGLDQLPNGAAWYDYRVKTITTTDLTPAQIHELGLSEVARIQKSMKQVMEQLRFNGELNVFFDYANTDARFAFDSEAELLKYYGALYSRVQAGVPRLFAVEPQAKFEIRPVEAFRAQAQAAGSYQRPSEDGSRPGIFYVNTYDLPSRKTWSAESLFLHEAIPGHHFQIAIQQELPELPAFRRFGRFTAFSEGWGLYAESLGKDLGVYTDPWQYFGRLQAELFRAVRLVVDTGLHSMGWTRQQVIAYMMANAGESETQAIAETERYIAIPGQALAYKIGELKILELRAKAQKALGGRFDIRDFHTQVLKDGAVPLDVLETKIDRWIETSRAR